MFPDDLNQWLKGPANPTTPKTELPPRPPLEKITTDLDVLMAQLDAADVAIGQSLIRYRLVVDYALRVEAQHTALQAAYAALPGLADVVAGLAKTDLIHGRGRDYADTEVPVGELVPALAVCRARKVETWQGVTCEEWLEALTAPNTEARLREIDDMIVACFAWKRAILERRQVSLDTEPHAS